MERAEWDSRKSFYYCPNTEASKSVAKKKTFRASERNKETVQQKKFEFLNDVANIDPSRLVFLDEAGLNLGMTPRLARAEKGERAFATRPAQRGSNISIVGAIRLKETPVLYPYDGAVDGAKFLSFLQNHLIPTLRKEDVVVMDNLRVHHIPQVREKLNAAGADVLYLPPYHPELNPIEEIWAKTKNIARRAEARTIAALVDAVQLAKAAISQDDLNGVFRHAGYGVATVPF